MSVYSLHYQSNVRDNVVVESHYRHRHYDVEWLVQKLPCELAVVQSYIAVWVAGSGKAGKSAAVVRIAVERDSHRGRNRH